jgi:molecular chaperone DnaJ
VSCITCNWEGGSEKTKCTKCNGHGQVTQTSQSIFGTIQQTVTCDECSGSWESFKNICNDCHWEKRKVEKKKIDIEIPAWIDNGMIIKMTWEWNDWVWTKASWDLYIKFTIPSEEKDLKRDGVNLYYTIEVDVIEVILWTNKDFILPIIWKRNIEIKPWTSHGTIIKVNNDWVKHIDSEDKWDLIITVNIKIPKKLSKKERDHYEAIAAEKKLNVNKSWVFEKIFK